MLYLNSRFEYLVCETNIHAILRDGMETVAKTVHSPFLSVVQNPHKEEAFYTHTHRELMLCNRRVLSNILLISLVSLQPGLNLFN